MERHVMRVETFGGLAVWLDDQPLVRHGKRINKNLELLALLAINGRAPLSNEALAVCAEALLIFPDDMGLQIIRFAAMQRLNMKAAVRSQYPLLAERLMERQGQAPPARLRAIHQWATEGESLSLIHI